MHPRADDDVYVFTEEDWCDSNTEGYKGAWTAENIPKVRDIAYAMGKAAAERMLYTMAAEDGRFDAISILPSHVLGPLLCAGHDQPWSWQNCVRQMMQGHPYTKSKGGRMLWNVVDVRDVALAHVLCAEVASVRNGSRYLVAATDSTYELFTHHLQARLTRLFPDLPSAVGGEEMGEDGMPCAPTPNVPHAYSTRAVAELGLKTHSVEETLRDMGQSIIDLGLLDRPVPTRGGKRAE